MTPTATHIQSTPDLTLASRRRASKRPSRHPVLERAGRARVPHARLTFAESPELYMREEMI